MGVGMVGWSSSEQGYDGHGGVGRNGGVNGMAWARNPPYAVGTS
jgi:hypothetical protein